MKNKKGFTLVELLVVIAILAILATVSIVGYTSFIDKANKSNALVEATQVRDILTSDDINNKKYEIKDDKIVFAGSNTWDEIYHAHKMEKVTVTVGTTDVSSYYTIKSGKTAGTYNFDDFEKATGKAETGKEYYKDLGATDLYNDLSELTGKISCTDGVVTYELNSITTTIKWSTDIKAGE